MKREFLNGGFLIILCVSGGLLVVGGYYAIQSGRNRASQSPNLVEAPNDNNNSPNQSMRKVPAQTGYQGPPAPIEVSHPHRPSPVGPFAVSNLPISAKTLERIEVLSESLPHSEGKEQVIALLANEMDALSVATYLRSRNWFGEAGEYVDLALTENPNSFEALLLWCQLQPPDQATEREDGFRKLLEMNPNSVDALVGLGTRLSFDGRPEEAIVYLEKASLLDPERPPSTLGFTYEELGEYDKALVALKNSYKITRSPVELAHIRAIEAGNPLWTQISRESEAKSPKETISESPLQVELKNKKPSEQVEQ